jgi:hypothetical protein
MEREMLSIDRDEARCGRQQINEEMRECAHVVIPSEAVRAKRGIAVFPVEGLERAAPRKWPTSCF